MFNRMKIFQHGKFPDASATNILIGRKGNIPTIASNCEDLMNHQRKTATPEDGRFAEYMSAESGVVAGAFFQHIVAAAIGAGDAAHRTVDMQKHSGMPKRAGAAIAGDFFLMDGAGFKCGLLGHNHSSASRQSG
jgi:hypothetical protein